MATNSLVFGCKGMLARALKSELETRGIAHLGMDLPECDLTRPADVAAAFQQHRPKIVYNCAAYTKVDQCEQEQDLCNAVNGQAVGTLAEMCKAHGSKLIHISTDFVFNGQGTRPYLPADAPAPLSAYGRSKLLGEKLLKEIDPPGWAIVRTAWLYGVGGPSFPRTMVEVARAGKPLRVVNDQIGCPTYTVDLARAMVDLSLMDCSGIFHCTNSTPTNWYVFAHETLQRFGIAADLQPITSGEYRQMRPTSAYRPSYSVLDCTSLEESIGRRMRPWQDALGDFVAEVQKRGSFV